MQQLSLCELLMILVPVACLKESYRLILREHVQMQETFESIKD